MVNASLVNGRKEIALHGTQTATGIRKALNGRKKVALQRGFEKFGTSHVRYSSTQASDFASGRGEAGGRHESEGRHTVGATVAPHDDDGYDDEAEEEDVEGGGECRPKKDQSEALEERRWKDVCSDGDEFRGGGTRQIFERPGNSEAQLNVFSEFVKEKSNSTLTVDDPGIGITKYEHVNNQGRQLQLITSCHLWPLMLGVKEDGDQPRASWGPRSDVGGSEQGGGGQEILGTERRAWATWSRNKGLHLDRLYAGRLVRTRLGFTRGGTRVGKVGPQHRPLCVRTRSVQVGHLLRPQCTLGAGVGKFVVRIGHCTPRQLVEEEKGGRGRKEAKGSSTSKKGRRCGARKARGAKKLHPRKKEGKEKELQRRAGRRKERRRGGLRLMKGHRAGFKRADGFLVGRGGNSGRIHGGEIWARV